MDAADDSTDPRLTARTVEVRAGAGDAEDDRAEDDRAVRALAALADVLGSGGTGVLSRISVALVDDAIGVSRPPGSPTAGPGRGSLIAVGEPLAGGIGAGEAADDADEVVRRFGADESSDVGSVLVVHSTGPADTAAIAVADAVVTAEVGAASHTAIVARSARRPAVGVVDAPRVVADALDRWRRDEANAARGEPILVVNGDTGEVRIVGGGDESMVGPRAEAAAPLPAVLPAEVRALLAVLDSVDQRAPVTVNAESAEQVRAAAECGVVDVGLCRTERWLTLDDVAMLDAARQHPGVPVDPAALDRFVDRQRTAVAELLGAVVEVGGNSANIRLLDTPVVGSGGPHPLGAARGARFLCLHDEIAAAQIGAIVDAWQRAAPGVALRLVVPFVSEPGEVAELDGLVGEICGAGPRPALAAMIETPRAALCADALARRCDTLLIGTNDLTQLACGLDRDATPPLVAGRYGADPFVELDHRSVMRLALLAIETARGARSDVHIAWCGDQLRDPGSLASVVGAGLGGVSVPCDRLIATRLVAAQVAVNAAARGAD